MKKFSLLFAAVFGLALQSWAGKPEHQGGGNGGNEPPTPPAPNVSNCAYGTARAELDINNVRTLLFNGGDMWWDLICCARYEIPKVDDPGSIKRHSLYAASIWVSGRELGTNNIYVMAQTYRSSNNFSFWPGPIDAVTTYTDAARCQVWDKMFKINRTEVQDFEARYAANLIQSINDIPESVLRWPGRGNPYLRTIRGYEGINTNYDLARFIDNNGDGIYDPLAGDSPRLPGREAESSGADQCVFWVMNDVGNTKRFQNNTLNNRPIGMEIQTEAFAYATSDYTNDMTFYRQKLINKGTTILGDCYFGQWCDPDLGYGADDYVEFNVPRGLAICYNGDEFDEGVQGYGANPPSVALDFFKGPAADPGDGIDNDKDCIVDEEGELIIASSFVYYNNSSNAQVGDPSYAQEYFNYQRSIWKNNTPMTYDGGQGTTPIGQTAATLPQGVTAQATHFLFPGASDQTIGWSVDGNCQNPKPGLPIWTEQTANNTVGDRRMLTNAGPFTLRPGAVNELTIGVVWARTTTGGATGSFNKLLAADDAAQKLFDNDFKILDGPDAPDVEITEMDQQLLFTIIPHQSRTSTGVIRTTETYQERDFNARLTDPFYRFEGYLVYQLADPSVGFGDLDNPDKAKLLANVSSDIKNGVGTIINDVFDENTATFLPRVQVRGTDRGLVRTFAIDQDLFDAQGNGKLVNFKRYYFTVLAYGYNGDSAQQVKFILGRQNRQQFAAMPHKVNPENGGTVLNATYNQSLNVTRLQGQGNGGAVYDSLQSEDEIEIVSAGSKLPIRYTNGKAPVSVRIYNPKKVVGADLKLRLYSRVSYVGDINQFNVGDVIESAWNPLQTSSTVIKDPILPQKQGRAIVMGKRLRQGTDAGIVDLEVEMLNDANGGRFTTVLNQVEGTRFVNYIYQAQPFRKQSDPGSVASCTEYAAYDFWRLFNDQEQVIDSSSRPLTLLRDQIAASVGVLISVGNVYNPGEFNNINPLNGLQESSIVFGNRSADWLATIPSPSAEDTSRLMWWRAGDFSIFEPKAASGILDQTLALRTILGGSFASYGYVAPYASDPRSSGGTFTVPTSIPSNERPGYENPVARVSLSRIQNVDVVLTNDKSKWTRCVVIQGDSVTAAGTIIPEYRFTKSRRPSIDVEGNPTGSTSAHQNLPSRGVGYFPGYAVDLDRGIRLNMAFLESQLSDRQNGNNLKWEPLNVDQDRLGGKNYIYVFASKYDEARENERKLDSINGMRPGTVQSARYGLFWQDCIWLGRLARQGNLGFIPTQTRIRLRVDKGYESYPDSGGPGGIPTYAFSTKGLESNVAVRQVAKDALGTVRVVPNPYYAYSSYETSQIDNRVRIINLPTRFELSIYNLSGSLIRQFKVDNSTQSGINRTTFLDWDLKTQTGLPIASGTYVMHINAYELGEKTVKWFGIMRPTDLDAISN